MAIGQIGDNSVSRAATALRSQASISGKLKRAYSSARCCFSSDSGVRFFFQAARKKEPRRQDPRI
jgi:hypothetical protein